MSHPVTAVVMNMFYTGLGIARSLGQQGVPVVGLTAERGVYGNFTRYARMVFCADSRNEPELLLEQLLRLARELGHRSVLFPTRDHDLVFLDRFRAELEPHFILAIAPTAALKRCLNKWDTYEAAVKAGVPSPRSWLVSSADTLQTIASEVTYPCVVKPLSAHYWRTGGNWDLVGGRKAIEAACETQLLAEYAAIAKADARVLVQEMVAGDDECLIVAACYLDAQSRFVAGFNAQKLVQTPPGFGTGCIVRFARQPELFDRTIRLLQALQFTGIAEVEYKWDASEGDHKLIEINPRPWDQHRLGWACGVDLIYVAYCDHTGLPVPARAYDETPRKWIAEDAFLMAVLRMIWRGEPGLGELFRQARGSRVYAIWALNDPLPFVAYLARLIPQLIGTALGAFKRVTFGRVLDRQKAVAGASR